MTIDVPQEILDALTDVDMPRLPAEGVASEEVRLAGIATPIYRAGCVVVGSGAAGLRAAVEMKRRGVDVVIISQSAWGGTSACSGSDKQTLHTANTADQGDNYRAMARAIGSGGAMDEDTAYVEAVGSSRMMASLQFLGLPLPQDPLGGTLRYQTDHDEVGRATSCGPRTSRLMVKVLAEEAIRLGVPFYNQTTAVKILTKGEGAERNIAGMLVMRAGDRTQENPLGIALFVSGVIVLAAGGPGELYRDSVYPNGCFGSLGLALEAGVELVNLTESQFGIGTRREGFPWNLSGTYVQAIPHFYSVDGEGAEHHFLARYYRSTQELASNIFRKGYQWPFHATRMLDFGSSLVDLAIYRETAAGRRVFMDFNRNPLPVPGDLPFSLERLDEDVRLYLGKAGADQQMPIHRLKHMNPLAIELYRRYKIDIAAEPLEFAVNNQHMNGGIMVDSWGRTNLGGCYAVGEAAGTHGVTRPGGAALNAGQVFGTRVAEHIGAGGAKRPAAGRVPEAAEAGIANLLSALRTESPLTVKAVRSAVQARMSEKAGIICDQGIVRQALIEARALNAEIRANGLAYERAAEAVRGVQWRHMALASEAVLSALDFYIGRGGGSRGARAICDAEGEFLPLASASRLEDYRFRKENEAHRKEQIVVRLEGEEVRLSTRPNRELDKGARSFFERDWPAWLTGRIYDLDGGE
ncbi:MULTISPECIES: FAD-dependent oxidoreductase [Rhizobium]|uniref:FAD-dependent oxidoreductase n=1 Tax=Rhizobium TaxID=379 RepID=UPI0007EBE6C6|nr:MULTISPECIES: FAD-binding protein [Rhizobium]ANK85380.1 fumarate reductase/succinate dehydrogenase flavoprotein-like protein [Rhizobium sp. N731]ANK91256.1 fumarate reductase/succinate dehydrogenase flavoprotein-like protein [Rhizobium sp. N6212]ANK97287.1 fumarate reductase/succinate dehydrogenase flavoprotein-like protein [Rhizobium sp. N621]ANL03407.1 fumarate reductase/succinate dehydrogenase flavoprotein-like protein [Rhizobium esperanzae]ANL09454.1 fumarate reductase/succinate dehydro